MAKHIDLGEKGEAIAQKFLIEKGYLILETNWRCDKDELDIIAQHDDTLVIIEVKTRSTNEFGEPEEAVNYHKEQTILRATEAYLLQSNIDLDVRYDIIAVIIDNGKISVNHIEDAFYAE